jgi:hypothetical protein
MMDVFKDLVDVTVLIFLDDILIYSKTEEDHLEHVRVVLDKLRGGAGAPQKDGGAVTGRVLSAPPVITPRHRVHRRGEREREGAPPEHHQSTIKAPYQSTPSEHPLRARPTEHAIRAPQQSIVSQPSRGRVLSAPSVTQTRTHEREGERER